MNITGIHHPDLVAALVKDPDQLLADLTPESAHMLHMAVGVSGEAGELLDAVKRHAIYNRPIDLDNVIEELGDLEFYMEGIRQSLSISREDTLVDNITKLSSRYARFTFTNEDATLRADKR